MFPTGLPSPNPPAPSQEARAAASDVHSDSSLTPCRKRKIHSSDREDTDSVSASPKSPKAACNSSASSSSSSQHVQKKLRFEQRSECTGLDAKMAEESPNASCSKAKSAFFSGHANGLTKSAGSATFANSKPGAAKKLVIKNFKGKRAQSPWPFDPCLLCRFKNVHLFYIMIVDLHVNVSCVPSGCCRKKMTLFIISGLSTGSRSVSICTHFTWVPE